MTFSPVFFMLRYYYFWFMYGHVGSVGRNRDSGVKHSSTYADPHLLSDPTSFIPVFMTVLQSVFICFHFFLPASNLKHSFRSSAALMGTSIFLLDIRSYHNQRLMLQEWWSGQLLSSPTQCFNLFPNKGDGFIICANNGGGIHQPPNYLFLASVDSNI